MQEFDFLLEYLEERLERASARLVDEYQEKSQRLHQELHVQGTPHRNALEVLTTSLAGLVKDQCM